MIPDSKYPEIVKGLLEKTRQQKAIWEELPGEENAFRLRLRNSTIELRYFAPSTEPDIIAIILRNSEGRQVGSWNVTDGEPYWALVNDLYDLVVKKNTGWDKVLEEIEAFLKSS
jgi:hypothetical protein